MKATPYKIRVTFLDTPKPAGFIDGYTKAATARAEVDRINATTTKTRVVAMYLGDERKAK